MGQKTLLAITPGHPGQLEALESDFRIIRLWQERNPEAAIREHANDIIVVTTTLSPVSAKLMQALPNLELIGVGAVGIDHIDMQAAKNQNITVVNTPDVLTEETADLGMALLLSLSRRIVEGDAFVRAGLWKRQSFPLGVTLNNKTVGIVGLGKIGQSVARKCEAFNVKVAYTARSPKDLPYEYVADVIDLASKSDFLVLTCPGTPETKDMIDYNVLAHLGERGFLINIARGSVVKEDDLLAALDNKIIAGAALDVYADEPNVPEGLFKMDNVVLTPHIGSATKETRRDMGDLIVANIRAPIHGQGLLTPVRM